MLGLPIPPERGGGPSAGWWRGTGGLRDVSVERVPEGAPPPASLVPLPVPGRIFASPLTPIPPASPAPVPATALHPRRRRTRRRRTPEIGRAQGRARVCQYG